MLNPKKAILCLVLPIAAAFAGYFLSPYIWNIFSQKKTTELFRFICSIVFFIIPALIIFISTRKSNSIITFPDAHEQEH